MLMRMKQHKYLEWIVMLYITMQIVSDVSAGKIIQLGILTVSATVFYFPFTYIFADILTEVYGYAESRRAIWKAFFCSVIAGLVFQVIVFLPPAMGFDANDAYTRVLGSVPRILIGGWIAVWAGAILNDYVLAKMKVWTNGKYLWARTIGSTVLGEGVNTILFYSIALYGVIPNELLVSSVLSGWFIKTLVEIVMTPVTYVVIKKLKKTEGIDYYDKDTDFNPFTFGLGKKSQGKIN